METAGRREGEITEEGGASGLGKNGTDGSAVSRDQFQGAQGTEFDHSSDPAGGRHPVVTVGRLRGDAWRKDCLKLSRHGVLASRIEIESRSSDGGETQPGWKLR